jgi:hypothetical protein
MQPSEPELPPEDDPPVPEVGGTVGGVVGLVGVVGAVGGLEVGVVVGLVFPPDEDEDEVDVEVLPDVDEEGFELPHKVVLAGTPLCSPGRGGFKQGSLVQTCKASVLKYLHLSLPGLA